MSARRFSGSSPTSIDNNIIGSVALTPDVTPGTLFETDGAVESADNRRLPTANDSCG